jgi:hypothetical protein
MSHAVRVVLAAALVLGAGPARAQDGDDPEGAPPPSPHAGVAAEAPGAFQPPEDTEHEDPTLPPGTIVVELRGGDDRPVAGEPVTLGILVNSIAKGDSRRHLQETTDAAGRATFRDLQTASNIAYRVSAGYQGGAFAAMPFQLQQAKAMRVVLHVYPVVRDVRQAMVVSEVTVAAELKDDRIQIEEVFTVYNLGRTAWQPDDVRFALPEGFTAFRAQQSMSDQGVDSTESGGRLRGTFAPGRHDVEFGWQLPWSEEKDVDIDVGLPPHVAIARVMMPASAQIRVGAQGFPPAELRRDTQGQSFQVTERRLRPDDARLTHVSLQLRDLPTPGPQKYVVTGVASCAVALGLWLAATRRRRHDVPADPDAARRSLLEQLAELERARAAGDVGPRTYERVRREIIDAVARTLLPT